MPNYQYQCSDCEYVFEENLPMKQMNDPIEKSCPNCNKLSVKRSFTKITVGDPFIYATKIPSDYKEHVLDKIKRFYPNNNINS